MKKFFLAITLLLVTAVIGAGAFAATEHRVNERYGFYAEAQGGTADGLERVYLAEITFNNLNLPDGSVVRALQVYVDKEKLIQGLTGFERDIRTISVDAVLGALQTEFSEKGYQATYEDGFLEITLQKYDSLTDLYLSDGRTGYENGGREVALDWGFWYNTYSYSDLTVFSDIKDTIIESIALEVENIEGINPEDIAFIYNYGTHYSKRTIDSDADKIYYFNKLGIQVHKFVMDETTLNREYTIYQHAPNVVTWYLLAMLIVAIPAAAFTLYAYKKKKEADGGKE